MERIYHLYISIIYIDSNKNKIIFIFIIYLKLIRYIIIKLSVPKSQIVAKEY